MVQEGVIRRSEDALSDEISRGISPEAVDILLRRLLSSHLGLLLWAVCAASIGGVRDAIESSFTPHKRSIAVACLENDNVVRVYFDIDAYHMMRDTCVTSACRFFLWTCSTVYAANDVSRTQIRHPICSH
jgi:hypothetical protein